MYTRGLLRDILQFSAADIANLNFNKNTSVFLGWLHGTIDQLSTKCTEHKNLSVTVLICPISPSIYGSTALVGLGSFFQFLNIYRVGRTPLTEDQLVARPLPTHRATQTQNKSTHTCMPRVGFEPTIPVFERVKTVHVLDCSATVIKFAQSVCAKLILGFRYSWYEAVQDSTLCVMCYKECLNGLFKIMSSEGMWLSTGFGLDIRFIDHLYT
jgi:hypothetical protein